MQTFTMYKPGVADALDVEKSDMSISVYFFDEKICPVARSPDGYGFYIGHFHVGVGFQTEGQNRDAYEKY
jgi:hypothetical protein